VVTHALWARAIDDRYATADSDPVEIIVLAQPPTVSLITPTNGAVGLASSVIALTAAASDPDGFITKVEFLSGGTKLGEVSTSPYVFSWTNAVPGSYSLIAVATDNAGFTAVSAPVSFTVVAGFAGNLTLIRTGWVWKYFDQGLDQGVAWRGLTYNDAAWASGPAPLGYGDGDEATVVGSGPTGNAHVTTYFRASFVAFEATVFSALTVRVLRDDGAVVYLNGVEAYRTGMPEGTISFNTLANVTAVGTDETSNYHQASLDPSLLREGLNIIAVEVHQVQPSSSDISFDLALSGTKTFYAPTILQQPANLSAAVGSNATLAVIAGGTGPLIYQWRRNGNNLPGANQPTYSIDPVTLTSGGSYSVTVSNRAGVVVSREALMAVIVPNDYAQTMLADAPIHYYRFEETTAAQPAADLGNPGGIAGVYSGGVTVNRPTAPLRTGQAVGLDGNAGAFVALSPFHPGTSITVEAWVRLAADARPGSYHAIVARWDGSYELDVAPDERANFVVRNQVNAFGLVATPGPLVRGVWHHLAGIYDAGTLSIYWNGSLAGTAALAGTLRNGGPSPDRVLIGGTRDGSNSSFNWRGDIDEVAIYNRALSADRIYAHYQAGLPLPLLSIGAPGVVTWPAYPADVILQVTDSLGAPVAWQTDNSVRQEEDGFFRITVPFTGTNRFYRLKKP
jgi:hypothetical protein